jgi:hypothetical protein
LKRSAWILALLAGIAWPVACGFPTVQSFASGGGGSGTGNGSSTSSNHGGSSSSSNPTSAGGGGMTSTMSNGGNPSGGANTGGGGSTSTSTSTSGGGEPCPGAADPCDCDNDGHRRPSCPGDGSKPADDCADHDSRANPKATTPRSTPINGKLEPGFTLIWDFNCDGHETPTWPDVIGCNLGACTTTEGWNEAAKPACGASGDLEKCKGGLGSCSYDDEGNTKQSCL